MVSESTIQCLKDLKTNNNREWFLDNKKRYEAVKKEYYQITADFLDSMKPLDPALELLEVKNCVFRINRDIRFSKDKSPYKTHLGIWLSTGAKNTEAAGYYLQIDTENPFVGGGMYCPQPEQIQKIRKEINFFYDDLVAITSDKDFVSTYKALNRDENSTLKNPPRGYEKDNPALEFLKLKSYTATENFSPELLTHKDFIPLMVQKMIALRPLNEFLNRALEIE